MYRAVLLPKAPCGEEGTNDWVQCRISAQDAGCGRAQLIQYRAGQSYEASVSLITVR
jgi:hypothetical protein